MEKQTRGTVEKALHLLDLISEQDLSLQELAEASGFSRSTTHRLASLLIQQRYLESENQRYTLGYRVLELGARKRARLQISKVAQPIMKQYAERTSETVHLAVLDGTHIVIIEKVTGTRQLQVNSFVGLRNMARNTGVGRALIAAHPENEWPAYLEGLASAEQEELHGQLREVRQKGYALDLEASNVGVCCVATVIRDETRSVTGAVSFNGAKVYLPRERLEELAPVILECAQEIGVALRS
jgi:DNA-binding IclR family transcriptional regulator